MVSIILIVKCISQSADVEVQAENELMTVKSV